MENLQISISESFFHYERILKTQHFVICVCITISTIYSSSARVILSCTYSDILRDFELRRRRSTVKSNLEVYNEKFSILKLHHVLRILAKMRGS